MKNILRIFYITLMCVMLTVVAAAATVEYTFEAVDTPADAYKLVITATDTEGDFAGLCSTLTYDTDVVYPVSRFNGSVVDVATSTTSKLPCKFVSKTCDNGEVNEETGEPVMSQVMRTTASWTEGTLYTEISINIPQDINLEYQYLDADEGVVLNEVYFKFASGKTIADVDATTFVLDGLEYGNFKVGGGNIYYYDSTNSSKQTLTVVNSVVPAPPAPVVSTIPVTAGDVIYEGNKAPVVAAETGDYTLSITEGVVVVNTGYTAQKFYNVEDGAVTEDTSLANGVLSTNRASIRDDEKYSGIRYMSTFLTALKSKVAEYGYLVTAENTFTGLKDTEYELNMALHSSGLANKAVAYNGEKDIYWNVEGANTVVTAVVTNVPETEEAVQTYIATRPYYILKDGTVVYGETMRKTVYEVAYSIKKNDSATYQLYKDYIDRLLALVKLNKEPTIDLSPLFPAV